MIKNTITNLLEIDFPLIQAGMVWVSGANLAVACAKEGIIGTIGAGSMNKELLKSQIEKAYSKLNFQEQKRIAVNFPLLYSGVQEQIQTAVDLGVKIFITSAGSPKIFTQHLKSKGKIVIHVTSSVDLALKCEHAGVDAVIVEGFEAGGHNGKEEITSMVLIPQVVDALKIPVIAAGGFADARGILAAQVLGAQAVQMGTRFMMTKESSAHEKFKQLLLKTRSGDTFLRLKKHIPVRLINNKFARDLENLENQGATVAALTQLLGKGRAKLGMLEGDIDEGELEAGQIVGMISEIPSCHDLIKKIKHDYYKLRTSLAEI